MDLEGLEACTQRQVTGVVDHGRTEAGSILVTSLLGHHADLEAQAGRGVEAERAMETTVGDATAQHVGAVASCVSRYHDGVHAEREQVDGFEAAELEVDLGLPNCSQASSMGRCSGYCSDH